MLNYDIIKCPLCYGELLIEKNQIKCSTCNMEYSIKDSIPVFLTDKTATDEYRKFWDGGWDKRYNAGDHKFHKNNKDEYKKIIEEQYNSSIKLKKAISYVVPFLDGQVLNVGCGISEASFFAYAKVKKYIGIDYSFTATRVSQDNINKLGGNGQTIQANAELLPIESNSIDTVYSSGVLHHTPNIKQTLEEVFRVLKPNGKAVIGLYSKYSPTFIVAEIVGYFKSLFNRTQIKWYAYSETAWSNENRKNPYTITFSKRELKTLFNSLNFENINIISTGFNWGNVIPIFGKYFQKTKVGWHSAQFLSNKFGSMLMVICNKKNG